MQEKKQRRSLTEFKAEVVALVRSSNKSVGQICRDVDLSETAVRGRVQQAQIDAGTREELTTHNGKS